MSSIFDLFKKIEKDCGTSSTGAITYLVVGLGNPGEKYARTRHNTGFLAIDCISEKLGVKVNRAKFKSLVGECELGGKRALLMKPQTFMNNSGEAVREAMDFYKIPVENIIVIFDDISLPPGKMRIRLKGSAGGHNGVKSIIYHLESDEFPRIKIGVGEKPSPEYDLAAWVCGVADEKDRELTFKCIENAFECASIIAEGKASAAMEKYN